MIFFNKAVTKKRIGMFVDGPNILRKEFNIDLDHIRKRVEKYGKIQVGKIFLNQYVPEKLVEAILNQGFEPVIGMGKEKNEAIDVDVYMAVEAMDAVHNPKIDILCLVTRDADFLPLIQKAKAQGKEVMVIGQDPGFSRGMQRAADIVINLAKEGDVVNR